MFHRIGLSKHELQVLAFAGSGLGMLCRRVQTWRGLLALAYHRIGDGSRSLLDRGMWSATPGAFEAQVRFLKRHFDLIGPADLAQALGNGRGRHVLITFDDGYRDNYEWAFPILRSHGVGAIFFVSTGFLDRPRLAWWDEIAWMVRTSTRSHVAARPWLPAPVALDEPDRERAVRALVNRYKTLPGDATSAYCDCLAEATGSGRATGSHADAVWMTWDMVREMAAAGMGIGGHTVNHPVLAQLPHEQQEEEIAGCRARLEAELGQPMTCFSYPVGNSQAFNADTRTCLEAHGVQFAFSYKGAVRLHHRDPYDIRRLAVDADASVRRFRAVVTLPQVFT
jgi:peptidoglycan/xylan/chitin deacetylase (PgdA/CDA1 family)